MQPTLPGLFQEVQDLKKQSREIKQSFKDALNNSKAYQDAKADYDSAKTNKKMIERGIKDDFVKEFEKLDELKLEIAGKNQMMADLALNKLTKGETIDIEGYDPQFSVKFKKANVINKSPLN